MVETGRATEFRLRQPLLGRLKSVRRRVFLACILRYGARVLAGTALLYALLRAGEGLFQWTDVEVVGRELSVATLSAVVSATIGVIAAISGAWRSTPTLVGAAARFDTHYQLADRMSTAVEWGAGKGPNVNRSAQRSTDQYAHLFLTSLFKEVELLARRVSPQAVVPLGTSFVTFGLSLVILAVGAAALPAQRSLSTHVAAPAATGTPQLYENATGNMDLVERAVDHLQREAVARSDPRLAAYAQRLEDLHTGNEGRRIGTSAVSAEMEPLLRRLAVAYPALGNVVTPEGLSAGPQGERAAMARRGRRARAAEGQQSARAGEGQDLGKANPRDGQDSIYPFEGKEEGRATARNPELLPVEAPFARPTRVDMELTDDGQAPSPSASKGGLGAEVKGPVVMKGYWVADPQNLATEPRHLPPWFEKPKEKQGGPGAGGGGDKAGEGASGTPSGDGTGAGAWSGDYSGQLRLSGERTEGEGLSFTLRPPDSQSTGTVGRWSVFSPSTDDPIGGRTVLEAIPGELSGLIQRYFMR